MKKIQKNYVIGVDGGGTKTIAALATLKGDILLREKSGPSSPRNVGTEKAALSIAEAIHPLLKRKGKIVSTAIALPAIEEEYQEKKEEILNYLRKQKKISKVFSGKVEIFSDQLTAFRAGTKEKNGIVLISGTGCVAHGWKGNKEVKAGGWGYFSDEGSAFWVGQRVIQVILRDLDKRGKKTLLSELVFRKFDIKNINDFLYKIYSKNPTEIIPQFSILCDKATQKKDRIALGIMREAAKELALSAQTVIRELNFQKEKFPLLLVGSMFKSKIVLREVKKEVRKFAPKAQCIQLQREPVKGAIRLAMETR